MLFRFFFITPLNPSSLCVIHVLRRSTYSGIFQISFFEKKLILIIFQLVYLNFDLKPLLGLYFLRLLTSQLCAQNQSG